MLFFLGAPILGQRRGTWSAVKKSNVQHRRHCSERRVHPHFLIIILRLILQSATKCDGNTAGGPGDNGTEGCGDVCVTASVDGNVAGGPGDTGTEACGDVTIAEHTSGDGNLASGPGDAGTAGCGNIDGGIIAVYDADAGITGRG